MNTTASRKADKWLYLPIDIKTRELHGKTLLAAHAVKQGYQVVIGKKSSVAALMGRFPKGAFVGFGAHENFLEKYIELHQQGHCVVSMDEEGLLTFSEEVFQRFRLSKKTIPHVDCAITWGDYHASMMQNFCKDNDLNLNIHSCGNPRIDILSPKYSKILEEEISAIRRKHGKYFLFVSSFASCNHHKGKESYTQDLIKKKIIQTPKDLDFYQRYFDLKKQNFDFFCEMIPLVAEKYPDHKIIIRPHPSENRSTWDNVGKGHTNIEVCYEGSIHPWVLGAEAIAHHFCTTAIEAYVCNIPSIALRAIKDEEIETSLPYNCSYNANNKDELMSALDDILLSSATKLQDIRKANEGFYSHYISGVRSGNSCARIIESITPTIKKETCSIAKLAWLALSENILSKVRSILRKEKDSYLEQKFAALSAEEMRILLSKIAAADPTLKNIKVTSLNQSTCLLHE